MSTLPPRLVLVPLLVLAACGRPPDLLREPSTGRPGDDGTDGPYGALRVYREIPTRVTDVRAVDVVVPATYDGEPDVSGAPYPAVVIVHGGFVDRTRYGWLAAHLATRGYVAILPEHEALLAITEPGNGALALDAVRGWARDEADPLGGLVALDGPTAVMGHSLGGVMATRHWLVDETVDGLVMMAAVPNPGDPVEDALARPVLSLVGRDDGYISPDEVAAAMPRFPTPPWTGIVEGMNHTDWADDATPSELARDLGASRPQPETRRAALRAIDAYLDELLREGAASFDGAFDGVTRVDLGGAE